MTCLYCGMNCVRTAVYVVGDIDGTPYVKVGYSGNPVRRLASLRRSKKLDLQLWSRTWADCEFKAIEIEQASHKYLAAHWAGRGEWFVCPPHVAVAAVVAVAERLGTGAARP